MKFEILTIGDEILSGNIVDTNTAYLSDRLWSQGIEVTYHTGVRDDAKTIRQALLIAAKRADVILVTGGLGPTADDFTLEIAARTFKKSLVCNAPYLKHLKQFYAKRGRELTSNNQKQAFVPKGSILFKNKVGTAPGVKVIYSGKPFYFFPGVPKEMKHLFEDYVFPEILKRRKSKLFFESKMLRCFGIAESALDMELRDFYDGRTEIQNVRIGFRAHFPETLIKLSAWHAKKAEAKKLLSKVEKQIRERIGKHIYAEGETSLEAVVGELLIKKQKTLAVAESCTGGLLANRVTNIPGSSAYFLGGLVTYSNRAKMDILGVDPEILDTDGAVSSRCAIAMAQGVRKKMNADFGAGITGIAGPDGGTKEKPVGTVHIAIATPTRVFEKIYSFPVNREWFKLIVSSTALNLIRRECL